MDSQKTGKVCFHDQSFVKKKVLNAIKMFIFSHRNDLIASEPLEKIKHGDIIQLVHGITSRTLNSHNVAAPMSPQYQEVTCYIDYNISMSAQNLWKVDLVNKDETNGVWHTIISHVRLIHLNSSQALKVIVIEIPFSKA